MKRKLKAAFLGAGYMTTVHMKNLLKFPEITITAVCDTSVEKASAMKDIVPDVTPYDDFDKMLAGESFDILYVCIPPFAHNGQIEKAAAKGIHIFVEKPMALTVERGERMLKSVEEAGVITHVAYHMRYGRAARELKKLIDTGAAGKPTLLDARYECNSLHSDWWRQKSMSGGQVFEQIIHLYDLAVSYLGEPDAVSGYIANLAHTDIADYNVEDTSISLLKFKDGGLASISGTNCAIPWNWKEPFTVVCENVTAKFSDTNNATFYFTKEEPVREMEIKADDDRYYAETEGFLSAVWGISNDGVVPISVGLKSLKMVDAVCKSNGNVINI